MRLRSVSTGLLGMVLLSACADPPAKELGQAQGAIDMARAAGADRYAAADYADATAALQRATDAVSQRDFRLALNHALESREHAQNAARHAAAAQARMRREVERAMTDVTALLAHAHTHLATTARGRTAARTVTDARQRLSRINDDVQKVSAAITAHDFLRAKPVLDGLNGRIREVLTMLDGPSTPQSSRRR